MLKIFPDTLSESLEYPLIVDLIVERCATSGGKTLAQDLFPIQDFDFLQKELSYLNEVLSILQAGYSFPALAHEDCKALLKMLALGNSTLDEISFMNIKDLASIYDNLFRFIAARMESSPVLWSYVINHQPEKEITRLIDEVFDARGVVKSSASPLLMEIRSDLTKKRQQSDKLFYKTLNKLQADGYLADYKESVKDNRRVLAVTAAFKSKVQGLFHGSSGKSSVIFIEPPATIELNNDIAMLIDEEKKEIYRILTALTRKIAVYEPLLLAYSEKIYYLDFVRAKAAYGNELGGNIPTMDKKPKKIRLKQAYNPVLLYYNKRQGKSTVPLNIDLDFDNRIIVVSGPNAGGKSVALKTLGLLQMMLQSAIPIPLAPESRMGFFRKIMGDIGDSQSIENELSTYSSKLKIMKGVLALADGSSLVLIDEFGSGSDPELGSALAMVFLEELERKACYGIITTHFNNIKALASQLPRTSNASMKFDRLSFQPLYQLVQGSPGSSYTYEVAEKSGIHKELIIRAKEKLQDSVIEVDRLLVNIQDEKQSLELKSAQLTLQLQELNTLKIKQEERIKRLEEKVERQTEINVAQSEYLMWGKRFQALVNMWEQKPTTENKKIIGGRFWKMMQERSAERLSKKAEEKSAEGHKNQKKLEKLLTAPIAVGDSVKLIDSHMRGVVQEIKKDKYQINFGNMSSLLDREKFIPFIKEAPKKSKKSRSND